MNNIVELKINNVKFDFITQRDLSLMFYQDLSNLKQLII